jgi:hypothetical protein
MVPENIKNNILKQFGIDTTSSALLSPAAPLQQPNQLNNNSDSTPIDSTPADDNTTNAIWTSPKPTKFVAAALSSCIKGTSITAKRRNTEKIFGHLNTFSGAATRKHASENYIVAYFTALDDLTAALQIKCTYLETKSQDISTAQVPSAGSTSTPDTQQPKLVTEQQPNKIVKEFYFIRWEDIKPIKTPDQRSNEKSRTIQVIDIPLGTPASTV